MTRNPSESTQTSTPGRALVRWTPPLGSVIVLQDEVHVHSGGATAARWRELANAVRFSGVSEDAKRELSVQTLSMESWGEPAGPRLAQGFESSPFRPTMPPPA